MSEAIKVVDRMPAFGLENYFPYDVVDPYDEFRKLPQIGQMIPPNERYREIYDLDEAIWRMEKAEEAEDDELERRFYAAIPVRGMRFAARLQNWDGLLDRSRDRGNYEKTAWKRHRRTRWLRTKFISDL